MKKFLLSLVIFCTLLSKAQDLKSFKDANGKYGYKDANGKIIINPVYDYAWPFGEGLAAVRLNNKAGFINTAGKEVIPFVYGGPSDKTPYFINGLILIQKPQSPYKYIDKTGKEAFPEYDWEEPFSEGLARVSLNDRQGFINRSGKLIIPVKFEYLSDFSEGLAAYLQGSIPDFEKGKWGFIDSKGSVVIPPLYKGFFDFHEGLASVQLSDTYGYIDKKGAIIIPFTYKEANPFFDGLARAKLTDKWMYINKANKTVIPAKFDEALDFSEGLACVKVGSLYGFVDKTGKEVISLQYEQASSFENGKARVKKDKVYFSIDKTGTKVE